MGAPSVEPQVSDDFPAPAVGARTVRAQHPPTRPERLERSPRQLGHASTRRPRGKFRGQYQVSCRVASLKFFDPLSTPSLQFPPLHLT